MSKEINEQIKFIIRTYYNGVFSTNVESHEIKITFRNYQINFLRNVKNVFLIKRIIEHNSNNIKNVKFIEGPMIRYEEILKKSTQELFESYEYGFNKIGIPKTTFSIKYKQIIRNIIMLLEEGKITNYQNLTTDPIVLLPISDHLSDEFARSKNASWYKKLLHDYIEYNKLNNKSDIVEKHYQEQARLHGMTFVKNER